MDPQRSGCSAASDPDVRSRGGGGATRLRARPKLSPGGEGKLRRAAERRCDRRAVGAVARRVGSLARELLDPHRYEEPCARRGLATTAQRGAHRDGHARRLEDLGRREGVRAACGSLRRRSLFRQRHEGGRARGHRYDREPRGDRHVLRSLDRSLGDADRRPHAPRRRHRARGHRSHHVRRAGDGRQRNLPRSRSRGDDDLAHRHELFAHRGDARRQRGVGCVRRRRRGLGDRYRERSARRAGRRGRSTERRRGDARWRACARDLLGV